MFGGISGGEGLRARTEQSEPLSGSANAMLCLAGRLSQSFNRAQVAVFAVMWPAVSFSQCPTLIQGKGGIVGHEHDWILTFDLNKGRMSALHILGGLTGNVREVCNDAEILLTLTNLTNKNDGRVQV